MIKKTIYFKERLQCKKNVFLFKKNKKILFYKIN